MENNIKINDILSLTAKIFYYLAFVLVFLIFIGMIIAPILIKNIELKENSIIFYKTEYKIRYFDKKIYLINEKNRIKTKFTKSDKDNFYEIFDKLEKKKIIYYIEFLLINFELSYIFIILFFKKVKIILKNIEKDILEYEKYNLIKKLNFILIIYYLLIFLIDLIYNHIMNLNITVDFLVYKLISIYVSIFYLYIFKIIYNIYTKEKLCKK